MTTDRELMQQALYYMDDGCGKYSDDYRKLIEALRARLSQPEPEPVATVYDAYDATGIDWHCKDAPPTGTKLYTVPPQREWQGLTDEEVRDLWSWSMTAEAERTANTQQHAFARAIEAKLKEKNGF